MLGRLCTTDESVEKNNESIERLWRLWTNRDRNIWKVHGESEHSRRSFKEFGETLLEKPIDKNVILSEPEVARFDAKIRKYERKIGGRFVNAFEDYTFVQEGISLKDPVARFFYKELNKAVNYERVNLSQANGYNKIVAQRMRDAYINAGFQGRWQLGNKFFNKLQDLAHKIKTSDNESDRQAYENELTKLVSHDSKVMGEASLLNEFKDLMKLSNAEFNHQKLRKRNNQGEKTEERYNDDVYEAAIAARALTNEMGNVMTFGLTNLRNAAKWKLLGTDKVGQGMDSKAYRSIDKAITEAIERVKNGIERGGYLPGYIMGDLIALKEGTSSFWANKSTSERALTKDLTVMEKSLRNISKEAIPVHARPKQDKLNEKYEENPMFILNQYAMDAVAFNKLTYTQSKYLETMKRLSEAKDLQWVEGMRKWIDEEFQISTEGLTGRDDWINNSVRTLMSVQVARTMGLNFTGAVVNATSIQFAAAHLGYGAITNARHQYYHGVTPEAGGTGGVKMKDRVDRVERRSGFLFNDVASELISEGLLPAEGIHRSKYEFDPQTGRVLENGSPLINRLKTVQDWSVEKGLMFHRVTENFTRKWMLGQH